MKKRRIENVDGWFIVLIFLLLVIGILCLYSTSAYSGRVRFQDEGYYLKKQIVASLLGIFVFYMVACMDYHVIASYSLIIYLISLGLSTAVLLFGQEYNGSKRWLAIGPVSFQPAEFAKVAIILFLAQKISTTKKNPTSLPFMVSTLIEILPVVGLVGINNLSTAVILFGISVILLFISNPRSLPFVGIGIAGVGFLAVFLHKESYRLERLEIWKHPERYEKGFQTIQGLYAIGSGGCFGRGFGKSLQKLGFVPEAQNDMIFSIICEETGLFGAFFVMMLFAFLLWRLMVHAVHATDLLGALILSGIMGHLALQVLLNIAVVTNTIPNTGITLPFISYGGTSILFLMGEMGLAVSVSRNTISSL